MLGARLVLVAEAVALHARSLLPPERLLRSCSLGHACKLSHGLGGGCGLGGCRGLGGAWLQVFAHRRGGVIARRICGGLRHTPQPPRASARTPCIPNAGTATDMHP